MEKIKLLRITRTEPPQAFSRDSQGAPLTDQWMIFGREAGKERFDPVGRIDGWATVRSHALSRSDLYVSRKECVDAAKREFKWRIARAEETVKELKKLVRSLK